MNTRAKADKSTPKANFMYEKDIKHKPEEYLRYLCYETYAMKIVPYKRPNAATLHIVERGENITVQRTDGTVANFKTADVPGEIVIRCSERIQEENRKKSPEETVPKKKRVEGKSMVPTKAALKQGVATEAPSKQPKAILKRPIGTVRDATKTTKTVTIAPKRDSSASSSASSYRSAHSGHSDSAIEKIKEIEANFQAQLDIIRSEVSEWKTRALEAEERLKEADKEKDIFEPFPSTSRSTPAVPKPVQVASTRETVNVEVHQPPSRYAPPIPKHKAMLLTLPPEQRATRCFNCDAMGHLARDCPRPRNHRLCYNCGQFGHKAFECNNPRNNSA